MKGSLKDVRTFERVPLECPLHTADGDSGGGHLSQDIYEPIINRLLGSRVIHSRVLPFLSPVIAYMFLSFLCSLRCFV